MRTLLLGFITCLSLSNLNAQFDWGNIFGGADFGYSKPMGDFSNYAKGGLTWDTHVGYKLTDNIGVGGAYIGGFGAAFDGDGGTGLFGVNVYSMSSYLAKGWYKFSDKNVSPYAGLGAGIGRVSEPDYEITTTDGAGNTTTQTIIGSKQSGLALNVELGLTIKRFNLAYSFNMSGKVSDDPTLNKEVAGQLVNYHRITMGYMINF